MRSSFVPFLPNWIDYAIQFRETGSKLAQQWLNNGSSFGKLAQHWTDALLMFVDFPNWIDDPIQFQETCSALDQTWLKPGSSFGKLVQNLLNVRSSFVKSLPNWIGCPMKFDKISIVRSSFVPVSRNWIGPPIQFHETGLKLDRRAYFKHHGGAYFKQGVVI